MARVFTHASLKTTLKIKLMPEGKVDLLRCNVQTMFDLALIFIFLSVPKIFQVYAFIHGYISTTPAAITTAILFN